LFIDFNNIHLKEWALFESTLYFSNLVEMTNTKDVVCFLRSLDQLSNLVF
jgi:hypothetical protein